MNSYQVNLFQLIMTLAIAISIFAIFISLYDILSGFDNQISRLAEQSPELERAMKIKTTTILALSSAGLLFGFFSAVYLSGSNLIFVPIGIMGASILGMCYAINKKLRLKPKAKSILAASVGAAVLSIAILMITARKSLLF